jgi:thiamine-monophosphate kinase
MINDIKENALISQIAALLPHRPAQLNALQQSDAELIRIPGCTGQVLAVTTDSIVEEVDTGLYKDPYLLGWMTVMANLSDLAAVGADPVGILIAETFPHDITPDVLISLHNGIREACICAGTAVLGGDTNFSDRLHTTGTAIGLVQDGSPLMRVPCHPGEYIYSTGRLGTGNAFAALNMLGQIHRPLPAFKPIARIKEGMLLRPFASACMDTSDGLLATLDQLGRLNNCGFVLESDWENHIAPDSCDVARQSGLEPWMLLAGPHGEFELIFTVPEERCSAMIATARNSGWTPIRLGVVTGIPGIEVTRWGQLSPGDLANIRNFKFEAAGSLLEFVHFLSNLGAKR